MTIILYYTSVSSSSEMRKKQQRIMDYLDSKKIPYTTVDISQSVEDKEEMRKKAGNPTALPPQLFNGDTYCGDFEMFENAVELETEETFFKL
ncbi:SH3 domain-binding glutamic acid-rich-like protein 3 [Lampris incognitus]|uniref:SH3 domain-binding glutamic acid-rich-like protein 3 n=1 Tax=Lampris incognitus TaxID=2546036 RepID=UPI0024B5BEC5|nr:SH3 domain-binding glutamic acid-rich-like protein 3 [Lampris incognitus]